MKTILKTTGEKLPYPFMNGSFRVWHVETPSGDRIGRIKRHYPLKALNPFHARTNAVSPIDLGMFKSLKAAQLAIEKVQS